MRAITLTQPWASLVATGAKRIETRSWQTAFRGPLAIHAAKGLGPVGGLEGLKDLCQTPPFCDALLAADIHFATELPLGAVVAIATLADCVRVADEGEPTAAIRAARDAFLRYSAGKYEPAFGDYAPGRFMWLLADVQLLPEPIPARGALQLWEWDAPVEVLALLDRG